MEASSVAKALAGNDKKTRDRSLKKLRRYIAVKTAKTGPFSEIDLQKLCKGLHYAMWMQDKPLLQEELSEKMCGLLGAFPNAEDALQFAAAFFKIQANEWARLDHWRMDKFAMLIRDFLRATFEVLKKKQWKQTLVSQVSELIGDVIDATKEANPDGLRLHLADIYLEELAVVGAGEVEEDVTLVLLEPFVDYIVHSRRDMVADLIIQKVFHTALEDETPKLNLNYRALQQRLFDAGKEKSILPRVRRKLYALVKRLSRTGDGVGLTLPVAESEGGEPVQGKRKREDQEEEKRKRKKKRRSIGEEGSENDTSTKEKSESDISTNNKSENDTLTEDKSESETPTNKSENETPTNNKSESETPTKRKKGKKQKVDNKEKQRQDFVNLSTPRSAPKKVVFDLKGNSSRDVQEFLMSASSPSPPYLPSRSPKQGILKDSPGTGTTPSPVYVFET